MRPSFFSLYKRGRYLRAPEDGDNSAEAEKRREERERFAVAALAFCLRHDEGFRRHFWEKVCRVQGVDPGEMPRITDGDIEVEPHQWADLRLTSVNGTDRFMWVIEAKAGAPLAKKQNPTKDEFRKKGVGYGRLFRDAEAKLRTKMRYIVLGANDRLGIPKGRKELGISVQERSWADLLKDVERKGIVKDLIDTFAELQIGEFYMEKARSIVVTGGIENAVNAAIVLDAVFKHLGVPKGKRALQSDSFEDGTGCFGYWVKQPGKKAPETYRRLRRATTESNWYLAWFGYEYDAAGKGNRAVWLCVNTETEQDTLKKIVGKRFKAEPTRDGEAYCVCVSSPLRQSGKDFDWFKSVVDCAISM